MVPEFELVTYIVDVDYKKQGSQNWTLWDTLRNNNCIGKDIAICERLVR